jgi:hypothetical protein
VHRGLLVHVVAHEALTIRETEGDWQQDSIQENGRARGSPGILAYTGKNAIGWSAIAPRVARIVSSS